jgi:DNA-binding NtrC family response regulator
LAKTVFLVDDDAAVLRLMVEVIELIGHNVIAAHTFTEAVAVWSSNLDRCNLAIVDYTLPDGSGANLAKALLEQRPAMPVVIMSGFVPELLPIPQPVRERVRFMGKPFTVSSLTALVSELLA